MNDSKHMHRGQWFHSTAGQKGTLSQRPPDTGSDLTTRLLVEIFQKGVQYMSQDKAGKELWNRYRIDFEIPKAIRPHKHPRQ